MLRKGFILSIFALIFLVAGSWSGYAAVEDDQADALIESLEEDRGIVMTPAEEMIELLKRKALRKVEEQRKAQFWETKGTIGLHMAYDNNVKTNTERFGDTYFEQYFSYSWVPTFNDHFSGDFGIWHFGDIYFDNGDTTFIDDAIKILLKINPTGTPDFEMQPKIERQYVYNPEAEGSSYVDDTVSLKLKHRFWKKYSHEVTYKQGFKEYDKKKPRVVLDASNNYYLPGMVLEKTKHTVDYKVSFPIGKFNINFKPTWYKETSNDAYKEYYDVSSFKTTTEISRTIFKKISAKFSYAFERKNYHNRTATGPNVAQYDDIHTQKMTFYYPLKKGWTLSYAVSHKKSDSNLVTSDYDKVTHKAGVYISF